MPTNDLTRFHFRPATAADADLLLALRNDPVTREQSTQTTEVTRDEHLRWLAASLQNDRRVLLLFCEDDVPVGTLRADRLDDGRLELSWTVTPAARGQGVGTAMLRAAVRRFQAPLVARIKQTNTPSARMAAAIGFSLASVVDGIGTWLRTPDQDSRHVEESS